MLLIHPPIAKPCEPPAGIARLAGMAESANIPIKVLDANLDGILRMIQRPIPAEDTWTRRALKNLPADLNYLRNPQAWEISRYTRSVMDIHRILEKSLATSSVQVSLGDYQDSELSPLKSADLLHSAETFTANPFYSYFQDWLLLHSSKEQDEHVGFSLNFLSQALTVFAMIGYLRRMRPDVKIILGGGLTTSWLKRSGGRNPFGGLVDVMVDGPGEEFLGNLFGAPAVPVHVCPRYDLFPLRQYLSPGFILPYSAASGCYWRRCLFCPEKSEKNSYLPAASKNVMADLVKLIDLYHPVIVHFLDNAMSPALLQQLIKNPLNAPWYGFVRLTEHLKDPDFCIGLKKSGCVMLKIGIESGNQSVLDALNKGIDLGTASAALKNLKNAGIAAYLYFLFGTPPEGLREARDTLTFVRQHHEEISFLNLAIFNMPVNSPEAGQYLSGRFYEGDLSLYASFEHPQGWNRDKVRKFLDSEFRKDPAVKPILQRNPPFFTSNHAVFYAMGERMISSSRISG